MSTNTDFKGIVIGGRYRYVCREPSEGNEDRPFIGWVRAMSKDGGSFRLDNGDEHNPDLHTNNFTRAVWAYPNELHPVSAANTEPEPGVLVGNRTEEAVRALLQDYRSLCEHVLEVAKLFHKPSDLPSPSDAVFDWTDSGCVEIRWEETSYGHGSSTEYRRVHVPLHYLWETPEQVLEDLRAEREAAEQARVKAAAEAARLKAERAEREERAEYERLERKFAGRYKVVL